MSDQEPTRDVSEAGGSAPAETPAEPSVAPEGTTGTPPDAADAGAVAVEAVAGPEVAVAPEPEVATTPEPEAAVVPEPEAAPEATAEPVDEPAVEAQAAVTAETEPTTEAQSTTEAQPDSAQEAAVDSAQEAAVEPKPAPAPAPRPTPRPTPRPPSRRGRPVTPAVIPPHTPSIPTPPALSEAAVLEAATWGRVTEDGTVLVREASGEREVGQYPDAGAAEAIAFYVRRYADLHAKIALFEARITATDLSVKEMDATLDHLASELEAPAAVGDLDGLRRRLDALRALAGERRAANEAERAAAKQAALEARTAMVEAAEKIAATDSERMQWRPAGEQLRALLDQWKEAQRRGPRLDRTTEDALWKRFSHARSAFDRERRRWFSELEKSNAAARSDKEQIVTQAEALATSTDWAATSAAFRDLMARWKAAGRASRKDDDALWSRFRAAQDAFFAARDAFHKQLDAEFAANLEAKLALLEQAEALLPVRDISAAKAGLRTIQDRWEKIGKVPRADIQRVEARLRAVEQAVREAEQSRWQRTNPETRARAEGAAAQLVAAIASLEKDLQKAKQSGNARKVTEIEEALAARRSWLEQVERAAADSRG